MRSAKKKKIGIAGVEGLWLEGLNRGDAGYDYRGAARFL